MENSGGIQYFADTFFWPQYVLEEKLRRQLTKTKLTSYKRGVVKLICWKVAWEEGACSHLAMTMTKFGWKNARLDEGVKDCSRRIVRTARFKLKFEWEDPLIVLILIIW
jgi:hypothetical protein